MLISTDNLIDFSSNDYLGVAKNQEVSNNAQELLKIRGAEGNGATGSRLLSGHNNMFTEVEDLLATFHNAETALLFNSGYDANLGFFSSVPQRGDLVLYDELIHASIRDGIRLGLAKSYKFKHNDLRDLERQIIGFRSKDVNREIYVVTESIFSMDGDQPDLKEFVGICRSNDIHLVVDEAHAAGIYGEGKGLLNEFRLEREVFARIVTFGKAHGCHGAAILGSTSLKDYLVNYARSLIYTTALPPHSLATILSSFEFLKEKGQFECKNLFENIAYFENKVDELSLRNYFLKSGSAIQCALISNNHEVERIAATLMESGFDVRAIRSPTVQKGKERLRFCIHSYNSKKEISQVLNLLKKSIYL